MYWIDTGWACGGVIVENDIIVSGAPIFKRFFGQPIDSLLTWPSVKQWKNISEMIEVNND